MCFVLLTYNLKSYRILGSFEVLGSPVSLVGNLAAGVRDFFYEPAAGFVEGPEEFARGLAKASFIYQRLG
jgi:hypothetical protein